MRDGMDPRELGERLQEARRARGLTQEDVAERLGVARTTVTALEKGTRRVRPDELIRLAELYGRSVNELLRERPRTPDMVVQFRAVISQDDPSVLQAVDRFKRHCDNYLFLETLCEAGRQPSLPEPYDVGGLPAERAGEYVARAERNRLGLGDGPIGDLRELLEDVYGLRVFFLGLPHRISGLFAFTYELGGCVAVNGGQPPERQRWSLSHELGHYLTNRFQADVLLGDEPLTGSRHERVADSFARHFLLPGPAVERRFDEVYRARGGAVTPADLIGMADFFGVSFQALIFRLEGLRRLPAGTWKRLHRRGFKVREARALLDLPVREARGDRFPRRYLILAAIAFARGVITEGQLAEILDTDRLSAREVLARLRNDLGIEDLELLQDVLSDSSRGDRNA